MEQSVPKHRNIKFRRRGITQKKTYNIIILLKHVEYNMGKVWNVGGSFTIILLDIKYK